MNTTLKKILIIDDEEDLCRLLKSFLTTLQYEVHTAYTLKEGLRCVESVSPDILFLDNNLPDGLGWDKIDFITQKVPSCKINLMSAYKFIPDSLRGKDSIQLIEKPISFSLLRNYLG